MQSTIISGRAIARMLVAPAQSLLTKVSVKQLQSLRLWGGRFCFFPSSLTKTVRWPRTRWPNDGAAKQRTDRSAFAQPLALCHFIVKKTYSISYSWQNVSPNAERCCSGSEMGSQALGARMRLPGFVVSFSLYGMWDNNTHGSVAASRGCGFMNYFLQTRICHFPFSREEAGNKPWHGWPWERQSGESPQHNLTFPRAEFNLQNAAVQLGGWFRVKVTYL